jgi:ribosomal protein L14
VDLFELHHVDGRPVSFDRTSVILIEPHVSGVGSLVTLGPIERPRDLHVSEEYAMIRTEVTMSVMDRVMRSMDEDREAGRGVPF